MLVNEYPLNPLLLGYLIVALGYEHGIEDHFVGKFSNPSDGNIINCIMFDGDAMPAVIIFK